MALDKDLDDERRRFVREGFDNDTQLAIFDMLRKETLAPAEIGKLKKAARELLPILEQRALLAQYWSQRASSRAEVETAILNYFWSELPDPAYDEAEINLLSSKVFQHLLHMQPAGAERLH